MGRSRCRKIRRGARRLARLLCCCTRGAITDQEQTNATGPSNSCRSPRRENVELSHPESVAPSFTSDSSDSLWDVSDLQMSDGLEEPDSDSVGADANEAESDNKQLDDVASDSELSDDTDAEEYRCEEDMTTLGDGVTTASSDSFWDISDLESEEEDETDGVISGSDKTGIAADHDSDLEDSSSDSDQSDDIEVAHLIEETKTERETPVGDIDQDTESVNDVDTEEFGSHEDCCHDVGAILTPNNADQPTLKTNLLAVAPSGGGFSPEMETCSLSDSEQGTLSESKIVVDMDKNTSMTETNEPGHSLRQSVKVYVANLMERVVSRLSEETEEVERSSCPDVSSEDKCEAGSVALQKTESNTNTAPVQTSFLGPATAELTSGVSETQGVDGDIIPSPSDPEAERKRESEKGEQDVEMLKPFVNVYISNLIQRVMSQMAGDVAEKKKPHTPVLLTDDLQEIEISCGISGTENAGASGGGSATARDTLPSDSEELDSETHQPGRQRSGRRVFEVKLVAGVLGLGLTLDLGHHGEIIVKKIRRFSRAAIQGDLKVGDHILEINGSAVESVTQATERLLRARCGEEVKILAARPDETPVAPAGYTETVLFRVSQTSNAGVILMKLNTSKERPLGVEIEGGSDTKSPYVTISSITPDSVADRCGILRVGDELVEIDGLPIVGATHSQALDIIRKISHPMTVTVQRRQDFDLEGRISLASLQTPLSLFH